MSRFLQFSPDGLRLVIEVGSWACIIPGTYRKSWFRSVRSYHEWEPAENWNIMQLVIRTLIVFFLQEVNTYLTI